MATSKIHTFEEVLESGITIPSEQYPINIGKIVIPRIQRAYAQGRKSEQEVRHAFLDDIFNCLCAPNGQILELSFLFGSKQPAASGGFGFELLDGQQRITTLFLLYWYLWNKEKGEPIPDYLKRFTYETRDTATQFINNIVGKTIVIGDEKPSKTLKSQKWFTEVFNCDATVCAMLTMLDAIDEKYKDSQRHNLFGNLQHLQFYVLYLDEFELNDELYIKMNSRGLDLTPFENFKAALIRFMKKGDGRFSENVEYEHVSMPYYLRFSTKMDTVWSDIFFSLPEIPSGNVTRAVPINNMEKDKRFIRFIIRYFFTQLVVLFDEKDSGYKPLEEFFYKNVQKDNVFSAESQHALEIRLTGWDNYEKVLHKIGYEGVCKLEKVLDTFAQSDYDIQKAICSNPYATRKEKEKGWNVYDEYRDYTLPNRVVFAAIVEFIAQIPDGKKFNDSLVQENLRKMLRVMWNVIENTRLEEVTPTIGLIKAMVEIINLPGAIDQDFYTSIVDYQSRNSQLNEEIAKAKAISSSTDPNWESAFIKAESHPYFKGMIRFFYDDSVLNSGDFVNRYEIMRDLFDKNGIAELYRKNEHILIRALISQMNFWDGSDGLKGKYITENSEKEGYLKILLGTKGAKELFCGFFGSGCFDIIAYLNQVVENAQWGNSIETRQSRVYYRLVNDVATPALLDKMFEFEDARKKQFHIVESCSVIIACIPYNERVVLDTERHLIIKEMVSKNGFNYCDSSQKDSMNSDMGDAWGWDISIQKELSDSKGNNMDLYLRFDAWRNVIFEIDPQGIDLAVNGIALEPIAGGRWRVKFPGPIKYDGLNDCIAIVEIINSIVDEIGKL